MSGKFIRIKKLMIPMITLVAIMSQTVPALAMTNSEAAELITGYQVATIETAMVEQASKDNTYLQEKMVLEAVKNVSNYQVTPAGARKTFESFTDYTKDLGYGKLQGHWAESNIKTLYEKGGIAGYPEGDFRANKTITAAELIALILNASNNGNSLTGESWSDKIMNRAYELGIATSDNISKTEANKPISREKMAYILVNSANKINKENTQGIKLVDTAVISDLNQASTAYRDSIRTAYSMGLLAGTGNGKYQPKANTTRAEATAIINRLFNYVSRVDVKFEAEKPVPGQAGVYTALPDGSNVGDITGYIYPAEGQIGPDGKVITRDQASGVLGYGEGQNGGIYLGIKFKNGKELHVNSAATADTYDNMSGHYEKHGDYVYWTAEWEMISGTVVRKLQSTKPNASAGTAADLYGNIISGGKDDKNAFFYMDNDGNWVINYDAK